MGIRTLDLFHGAGGSSSGAKMAGAEIIAGIDLWEVASQCYKTNFPEALAICDDIRKISPKRLHKKIGNIDLIIASPECTNHSCAKGGRERDEKSKLTAFQVIKFAKEFKPRWIIIENVREMASWKRHKNLLQKLQGLGYSVIEEKLNSAHFGVPQTRRRLFLICALNTIPKSFCLSPVIEKPARAIINNNGIYKYTPLFEPKRAKPTLERARRAIDALGENEPFLIVYYGTDGSGGWQSIDQPLRTITTIDRFAYVKHTENGYMMRMLQPEELKMAMGFPNEFKLNAGTRRDKIKLMGNAVCPPVMKSIVNGLLQKQQA